MTRRPDRPATGAEPAGALGWLGHSAWAVADQGLASAANFLTVILLARALDTIAYGAFAVAYQTFWVLGMVHASAVAEPTLVFTAGRYRDTSGEYLRTVMLGQTAIAVAAGVLALLLAALSGWADQPAMTASFQGLALAAPPMLTLLLLRRVAYARFQPRLAALGGAANLVLVAGSLVWLDASGRIGIGSAFVALAAAAALVCAVLWRLLRLGNPFARPWLLIGEVVREHGRYARWGVAAGAVGWVPGNVFYWILPLLPGPAFGLSATATLRALINLVMPVLQANAAFGSVLIPSLSARGGTVKRSKMVLLAGLLVGASAAWALLLVLFGEPLVEVLYDGRYTVTPVLLALLGAIPVCTATAHLLRGLILSRDRPDQMFWANLAAAAVALVVGLPLVLALGMRGVLIAIALGPLTQGVVLYRFARRRLPRTEANPPA